MPRRTLLLLLLTRNNQANRQTGSAQLAGHAHLRAIQCDAARCHAYAMLCHAMPRVSPG